MGRGDAQSRYFSVWEPSAAQVGEGAGGETGADEAECRVAALGAGIARTRGKNLLRDIRAGHLGPPRGPP